MKKIIFTSVFSLALIYGLKGYSQNMYSLDLTNPATYSVDCGTVNSAQWAVKNNHCSLITSPVQIPGTTGSDTNWVVPIIVTINSTGNLDCSEIFPDGAFIRYSIDYGPWYVVRRITACEVKNRITIIEYYSVFVPSGSNLRIKVSLANNSPTEKMWLKNNDIVISNPAVADSSNWYFKYAVPFAQNVNDNFNEDVIVYPNPANDFINIETQNKEGKIFIYNTYGQLLLSEELNQANIKFDISGLAKGMYIVVVEKTDGLVTRKFVKK